MNSSDLDSLQRVDSPLEFDSLPDASAATPFCYVYQSILLQQYDHLMAETSSSEMLDVVDLNDTVVDTKRRGEIHRLGLPHRSVHVLVFNASGALLLQKRSMQKDECAGMWDSSCAGHVEAGQHYTETAVREFDEELGIELDAVPEYLFKMEPTTGNGMEFAAIYRISHDGPFVVAEDEIDELAWFSAWQLDRWVQGESAIEGAELTTGFCEIWRRYRNKDYPDNGHQDSSLQEIDRREHKS